MQLDCPALDCFIPDAEDLATASQRTTQMGIGAHPDDLEIIAISGILDCYASPDDSFTGVVICDGAGSPRAGRYAEYSDAQMREARRCEQRAAAELGRYSLQVQLGFPSADASSDRLLDCLQQLLLDCRPDTLFLHNLADAHATHRSVARSSIAALLRLAPEQRPGRVYGVEVWRSLDWLPAAFRIALPVNDPDHLQAKLLSCHDSQISGGKRYDRAIIARQQANATLAESHAVDSAEACVLAMDFAPLLDASDPDPDAFLFDILKAFQDDLTA